MRQVVGSYHSWTFFLSGADMFFNLECEETTFSGQETKLTENEDMEYTMHIVSFLFFRLLRVVCLGTWEDQYYLEDHFLVSTYLVVESGLELCLLGWMARIFISLFIATSAGGYVCNWHRWIPMDI